MARKDLRQVQPIEITLEHGKPMASSLQVAKHFKKAHDNVLRDIREVIRKAPAAWASANFEDISISVDLGHATRQDPAYMMTRDGFSMLAMGFTGKKAFDWKIKYIEAFKVLEREVIENLRALASIRELVAPPEGLDPITRQERTVSVVRGQLIKWSIADKIKVDLAERTLCVFLGLRTLDHMQPEDSAKAFDFLDRQCLTFDGSGRPATEEQRTMIRYLVEACAVFRYSRGFNVLTYIKDKYAVTDEELDTLTERGANKLITALTDIMTLLFARTHNRNEIGRSIEESCEKGKLQ